MRILNLGCGNRKLDIPGAPPGSQVVGVDLSPRSQADLVHDLNIFPYPLETDSFDLVVLNDVIEHLDDVPGVLREVHRVARHGALVRIRTPHFSSHYAYTDPTHRRPFGYFSFDGFDPANPHILYADSQFRVVRRRILFSKLWRITGVSTLANRFPSRWEQLFAFIFCAENLEFELQTIKSR